MEDAEKGTSCVLRVRYAVRLGDDLAPLNPAESPGEKERKAGARRLTARPRCRIPRVVPTPSACG
jgi:hypothetical protein